MIIIQQEDFSVDDAYTKLRQTDTTGTGAICLFTGLVRDFGDTTDLHGIHLDHYPAMTEKALAGIIAEANERWSLIDTIVIHRVGDLLISEQIVLVGVSASHRADAFAATEFIMDYLKSKAPFWKKELKDGQSTWVKAKESDQARSARWEKN